MAGPARARLKPQDVQPALGPSAKNFENDFGLNVTIETLEKMMDSFPLPAQVAKGQDILIWAIKSEASHVGAIDRA